MSKEPISKRKIVRIVLGFVCCVVLVITTALCFMLDGQSKIKKSKTYFVNYIGRVINIIALFGNFGAVFKHKLSTQMDIRLYSALKQSGMFILSGCVLIYDPMIAAVLDNDKIAYANTVKSLFVAGMVTTICFFVASMVTAAMKPRGFKLTKPSKVTD